MAINPQLTTLPNGELWPMPFEGEIFGLHRPGMEINVQDLPPNGHGESWRAKGRLFLSSLRLVFIADQQQGDVRAFDLPLIYLHGESFNQPILGCNNLSGKVWSVLDEGGPSGELPPIRFKLFFKNGGVFTFLMLFFGYLKRTREPLPAKARPLHNIPPSEMAAQAFVDPNDPSKIVLTQPTSEHLPPPSYAKEYGKDEVYESME